MPNIEVKAYTGLDNRSSQFDVPLNGLLEANNVYLDDKGQAKKRDGYILRTAGDFHSVWSNNARTVTLAALGSQMVQILPDFTTDIVVPVIASGQRLRFVETVRDTIIYTNGTVLGRLDNVSITSIDAPTDPNKRTVPAGDHLSWFNARLYIAAHDVLWFTDAYTYNVDKIRGMFQFSGKIVLLQAVDDGLYVGDSKKTYFVKNDPPSRREVHNYPAIEYSYESTHSELFRVEGLPPGKVAMWVSTEGVMLGGNGGAVFNLTRDHYSIPATGRGDAVVTETNGNFQYLVNLFI